VRGQPTRLSPWAWIADAILAFVLVAATLVAAHDGGSLVVPRDSPIPRAVEPPDAVEPPGAVDPADAAELQGPVDLSGAWTPPVGPPAGAEPLRPAGPDRTGADRGGVAADRQGETWAQGTVDGPDLWGDPARKVLFEEPPFGGVPFDTVPYWQLVAAVLIALPLVARRWRPLAAYWVVLVATVVCHRGILVEDALPFTLVALLVAAYSAAVYSPHRALAAVSVLAGAAQVIAFPSDNVPDFRPVYVPFILLVLMGLAANAIHLRQQRAQVVATEQETASRRAVEQERARIARELHDVVTHNVSVMVIQAGAARKVLATAPEQAREAMLAVESSGRAAMTELRHVMGLLTMTGADAPSAPEPGPGPEPGPEPEMRPRAGGGEAAVLAEAARGDRWAGTDGWADGQAGTDGSGRIEGSDRINGDRGTGGDGPVGDRGWRLPAGAVSAGAMSAADHSPGPTEDELTPQPGLGQLPALVGRVRAAGVEVEVTTAGTPVALPAGIDLAAFRVVQEGLTNAVRHAAGARVRVAVTYRPGALRVDVTDSGGRPAAATGPGGGAGLVGLRERLAVYGGSLRAGRRPLGGFGICAEIPIEAGLAPLETRPAPAKGAPT